MNVNFSRAITAYSRDLSNSLNRVNERLSRGSVDQSTSIKNERDLAIISEEARRLQRSRKALGTHESSVDQKRDMIIPGQDQTELRLEKKLEQQAEAAYKPQKANDVAEANNSTNRLNDVENRYRMFSDQDRTEAPPSEDIKPQEIITADEELKDNTSVEANVNRFKQSSQIQAYASAANMTQASLIVNYKL